MYIYIYVIICIYIYIIIVILFVIIIVIMIIILIIYIYDYIYIMISTVSYFWGPTLQVSSWWDGLGYPQSSGTGQRYCCRGLRLSDFLRFFLNVFYSETGWISSGEMMAGIFWILLWHLYPFTPPHDPTRFILGLGGPENSTRPVPARSRASRCVGGPRYTDLYAIMGIHPRVIKHGNGKSRLIEVTS